MVFEIQFETYIPGKCIVSLRGVGSYEDFKSFVEKYLRDHRGEKVRLTHGQSWENMSNLVGDEYVAMIQLDPITQ